MSCYVMELDRLTLLVERLRDADALLAEDGVALQAQVARIRRSLAAGKGEAVRRHVERLERLTETLVRTDALDPTDGQAIIEMARRLLEENAG